MKFFRPLIDQVLADGRFGMRPTEGLGEVHTETDPNVVFGRFGPDALGETASGASSAAYLNADQRGGTATNGKPSLTIDEAAVQLTRHKASWGDYWGQAVEVTFAFRSTAPSTMPDDTSGFSRFNATQINATLLALQAWSDVANITFNRVGSGTSGGSAYSNNATMLFGNYSSGSDGAAAFAYYPYSYAYSSFDGDVWINSSLSYNANPQLFNYGHMVLIHEIGHAIGIAHPADYNAGDDENITYSQHATYFEDSIQYTVMSYFYETYTGASYGSPYPATIMLDDIAAAQRLYGANMTTRTGDTVYGFNSNSDRPWFTANSSSTPLIFAVWDAGGNDTFDFSGYSSNARIELREGYFSNVGGLTGNIAIAQGAVIENAKGGNGADTIIGNNAANRLQGNAGNDTLTGLGGADVFVFTSGGGADIVTDFVVGTDKLDVTAFGGYISIAQSGADTLVTFASGSTALLKGVSAGTVTSNSFIGLPAAPPPPPPPPPTSETLNGTSAADQLVGGDGDDFLYGHGGDDRLYGGAGDDRIEGGEGHDRIDGGPGADVMIGGAGSENYFVDNIGDQVIEEANAGRDRVISTISYTLGANVEMLALAGSAAINGTGNALDNEIMGNDAPNRLQGNAGADILWGMGGADIFVVTLGGGADTVVDFAVGTDKLDVTAFGSYLSLAQSGSDTLITFAPGVTVRLTGVSAGAITAASFIGLSSTPSAAPVIQGTDGDDRLFGGPGDDRIEGYAGDDRIDGGAGADLMIGGTGSDNYFVDNIGDQVIEEANAGRDRVLSTISYTLGANVEMLALLGSAPINGTGNALDNEIVGNSAANRLDGGAGADVMHGFAGDDVYLVDNAGDRVYEAAGEGVDWVYSSVSFTLGDHVEHLTLTGSSAINATGNGLDNRLYGNSGNNQLVGGDGDDRIDGGAGADVMIGGAGSENYFVDNIGDQVIEEPNAGRDRVLSTISYTLGANVELLALLGSAAINGTGNSLDNEIVGNGAANRLQGAGGADTLWGGGGADTFVYTALSDSTVVASDRIFDFDPAADLIDLSAIDANTGASGNQAFVWAGGFTGQAGQAVLTYDPGADLTTLLLDVNGDAAADFRLLINGHVLGDDGFLL